MEKSKHLSKNWNIAFPIKENNINSLMLFSDVHGLNPKISTPEQEDGLTYHSQSDNPEINQIISLEEKDRSMTELTVADCSSVMVDGLNGNQDTVPGSYIISPIKFSNLSNQLAKKQNADTLFCVKALEYSTGSQTVPPLCSKKPSVPNNTNISEEEALEILSIQLQDEYSCSTPKGEHTYADPSSKYVISLESSWGARGGNSRDACREAPDGVERQASDGQVDPGQVQVILNQEQPIANFNESVQAHANALATRLMMQKTSSNSSSDFMEKLSLIDVEKYGTDSLLSIPSLGPPCSDLVGEKLDISPILETTEDYVSDLNKKQYESREDVVCNIAKEKDLGFHNKSTHCSSENVQKNVKGKEFPLTNKSRIPRLIQNSTNISAQPSISSTTPTMNCSSNGSQNERSFSKSISLGQSFTSDHLPSNMFCSPLASVSLLSSAPLKNGNKSSGTKINNSLGRRCLSALALDSAMHTNVCDDEGKTSKSGGQLNRSSSVSMCSLPSSQKRANYTHIQSKVKQYIHDIKASQSRRASPSRSDTNSPCKTPTSSGQGNSIYLLNEDLLNEMNGALPDEFQSLVRQLEGASGDPRLLRTLFRVLMSERQTRSEHEHTLAAMQLSYDNLLAAHARSQNLIDELRLQVTASHNGSRERVYRSGFSSVHTSRASSPLNRQRRHSATLGGPGTTLRGSGCPEELSISQPNLIKETTRHITETNLGISLDESGSMYLFPTPFESNSAIALLHTDESVKSGPNITNESEESYTLPRSTINKKSNYSPENFNDQTDVLESSHISIARLDTISDQLNLLPATQPNQTYSKHTSSISASIHPLDVSSTSVSDMITLNIEKDQFVELVNRTSLKQPPSTQISSFRGPIPLEHKSTNFIPNKSSNARSAIPTNSAVSTLGDSDSWGTLQVKLKDFAALLSCEALTKQETDDVWAELLTTYTRLMVAVGGSETVTMEAAMQLLASKFGLTAPAVGPKTAPVRGTKTASVWGTKTQELLDTSWTSTMAYEGDSKLLKTAQEIGLNKTRSVITAPGHELVSINWSDDNHEKDNGEVAERRDGSSCFESGKDEFYQKSVGKGVRSTTVDSSSAAQCNTSAVTVSDANNEGCKETDHSIEKAVSAVSNYFTSIAAHDVSDNERVSESVQVPELDSIYTVNEDTSSLSPEDYSKYINVLKRLHWKLSRQENVSKAKNKVSAQSSTDYLSKIRSLNERIEQLCYERNGCSSRSSTNVKSSITQELDSSKTDQSSIQKLEENIDLNNRHRGHHQNTEQTAAKTILLTREAFASNDSLSPVSSREKVELWRERLVAPLSDSESDGPICSKTAAWNHSVQGQNSGQEVALATEHKKNTGMLHTASRGNNDGEPFTATLEWRYSIGDTPRPRDSAPLSKRFDLDSGCPISDRSFRHLPSPHVNTKHGRRHCGPSFSEKTASDIDQGHCNAKRDDNSVCNTKLKGSQQNGFKMKPFVEEHYPRSQSPLKTVIDGHQFPAWESSLSNGRHQLMDGIDKNVSDSDDQSSVMTGNSKSYDKRIHQTLLKLQRDVDLIKSKFFARTGTLGKTSSGVRHRHNGNDVQSPGERIHRASRTPVKPMMAFPPSTSDSDARSVVQEGHGGGVRRRTRRPEGIATKRSRHSPDTSHEVQLSPNEPSRSCKSCFNQTVNVEAHDSNQSRVAASPRMTRKRKKRSHSCPRMVPGKSTRPTFVDNQPACCHHDPEPVSDSRPVCRHPSLPLLSDTCISFSAVASRLVCCIDPPLLRQPVRHAITSKSTTDGRASQRKLQSNQDSDAESTYLPSVEFIVPCLMMPLT